jgi:integrase
MNKMIFSKDSILRISIPPKGRIYYQDIKEKGLSLYITDNGVITFFVRKVINGKDTRIIIGNFPDISVCDARKAAVQIKAKIAKGENPLEDKSFSKEKLTTFEMIFKEYMIKHSKKNTKTWKDDERDVNRFAASLFTKSASSITKNDLVALHQKIGDENGEYQANRFLDRLKSIFNKAIEWGHKLENPTIGIKKFKETARDRFLQKDEITALLKTLKDEHNTIIRDYILVSLLTGARKSNVCSMKWNQIDFYTKIWRIPETKNGDVLNVPITDKVVEILDFRKLDNEKLGFKNSDYVFPGKGITGHLVEPKKAWKNILNRAGIKDLRLHDLRRTFGSWQAIIGTSMQVIGKSLGHKSSSATEIYARLSMDPVRESVEKITKFILDTEE